MSTDLYLCFEYGGWDSPHVLVGITSDPKTRDQWLERNTITNPYVVFVEHWRLDGAHGTRVTDDWRPK